VEECDPFSLRSDARLIVNELNAGLATAIERRVEVVDRKADMVDSGTPFPHEPRDRRIWVVCLK